MLPEHSIRHAAVQRLQQIMCSCHRRLIIYPWRIRDVNVLEESLLSPGDDTCMGMSMINSIIGAR